MTQGASEHSGNRFPHGTMAEEAAKLVDVAHLWLASQSAAQAGRSARDDVWAQATATDAHEPPECRGCPYCRVRRALSDVSPEVYEHLADAVSSLGAALRAMDSSRHSERPREPLQDDTP
jgi:hypothetical protein